MPGLRSPAGHLPLQSHRSALQPLSSDPPPTPQRGPSRPVIAPLLARSIPGSRLIVGEHFDPESLLGSCWRQHSLLLYPGEPAISTSEALSADITQLIMLDGTWRKTAKLLHLNPWLHELPRLALDVNQPSRYRIRKSPRADGLSTIEAAVLALNTLHGNDDYDAILGAFELMIDQQIRAMGEDTYRRNYTDPA